MNIKLKYKINAKLFAALPQYDWVKKSNDKIYINCTTTHYGITKIEYRLITWSSPHLSRKSEDSPRPRHQLGDGKVPRKAYDGLFWQQGLMSYMFNLAALFQIYFVINVLTFFYFLLLPIATTFWWIRSSNR